MRVFLIKLLLRKLSKKDKHIILTESVKQMYNTISADDILSEKDGEWMFLGRKMVEESKKYLTSEAEIFLESKLWKILQADIKYQSNRRMFTHSQTENDLIAGKFILWTLDVIKTRLESMTKQSGKFNSK